jgi:hypothetical protein
MKLEFANVHFEGEIRTKWDALLRVVGDFALLIRGRVIYREVEFCLVEFAIALANWLAVATDLGPDFVYTSLESETEGLVRFARLGPGNWRVSAAHQDEKALVSITTGELGEAVLAYIRDLRAHLYPKLDILQYVEDAKVREAIQRKLER